MADRPEPRTYISTHTSDAIYIRDKSLVDELIGELSFTEMAYFQIMGERPTAAQRRILDAAMVGLMEHGLTPSVVATRMVYMSCPEALQSAVAAGLCAVGSVFVGTMEGCARLLDDIVAAPDSAARARQIATEYRAEKKRLPGFGHNLHKPDDPRTPRFLEVAKREDIPGRHIAALQLLGEAVDEVYGRHITINATGGIAAILREIDVPWDVMRGIAVIARAAGLVGHIREERAYPAGMRIWEAAEESIPYAGEAPFNE
jgi:citrate synthase